MSDNKTRKKRSHLKIDEWDKHIVEEINTIENEDFKKRLLALNIFRLEYKNAQEHKPVKRRWASKYADVKADYEGLIEQVNAANKVRELTFEIIILMGVELTRRVTKDELKAMMQSLNVFPL